MLLIGRGSPFAEMPCAQAYGGLSHSEKGGPAPSLQGNCVVFGEKLAKINVCLARVLQALG